MENEKRKKLLEQRRKPKKDTHLSLKGYTSLKLEMPGANIGVTVWPYEKYVGDHIKYKVAFVDFFLRSFSLYIPCLGGVPVRGGVQTLPPAEKIVLQTSVPLVFNA